MTNYDCFMTIITCLTPSARRSNQMFRFRGKYIIRVSVGIFCSTPGIPLVRSVGRKTAAYMLFTGHPITAEEAYNAGLVSRITENDGLENEVNCITSSILEKSRAVISLGKKFFYEQVEMDLRSAYGKGVKVMLNNLSHEDGVEGIKSFIEKRKPVWS